MADQPCVTKLEQFDNSWYHPGAGRLKQSIWYLVNAIFINSYCLPVSACKIFILRVFGAKIGKGVVIKPKVNIKYPWRLKVGNYSWIGEKVWIDNLDEVIIGRNVCLSQGSMLLCGNHDYRKETFDLITGKIELEDGVWVGANSVVCPGITCRSHSVLSVGSVATKNLEEFSIYQGNPAVKIRERVIR